MPFDVNLDDAGRDDVDRELATVGRSIECRTRARTRPHVRPDEVAAGPQLDPGKLLRQVIFGVFDAGDLYAALVGHLDIGEGAFNVDASDDSRLLNYERAKRHGGG